jgi:hypothetical protein
MSKIDDALKKLEAWLVCYGIATPEDMAQSFPEMLVIVQESIAALSQSEKKRDAVGMEERDCGSCKWGGYDLCAMPFGKPCSCKPSKDNFSSWEPAAPAPEPEGEAPIDEDDIVQLAFELISGPFSLAAENVGGFAYNDPVAEAVPILRAALRARLSPSSKEVPTNRPGHEREAQG